MGIESFDLIDRPQDAGWTWPVYRRGTGPSVIVLHELNGLSEEVLAFASWLAAREFTVWLPVLAGPAPAISGLDHVRTAARICVSREFTTLARGKTSRVVAPLRLLASHVAGDSGRLGVVGMCFSGGFAMALAGQPPVVTAVAAEPALPFASILTPWCRRDLGIADDDLADLASRLTSDDVDLLVTRFSDDWISPRRRLATIRQKLTTGLTVDELPSGKGNEFGFKRGLNGDHAVLTSARFKTHPDGAAQDRLIETADRVVDFLAARLKVAPE